MTTTMQRKKQSFNPFRWFLRTGWRHMLGLVVCLYAIFPILYILSTSLYPNNDINDTTVLFAEISPANYIELFNQDTRPFARWYLNTVYIGIFTSIGSVFLSALAAFAFSRLRFRGRRGGLLSLILFLILLLLLLLLLCVYKCTASYFYSKA